MLGTGFVVFLRESNKKLLSSHSGKTSKMSLGRAQARQHGLCILERMFNKNWPSPGKLAKPRIILLKGPRRATIGLVVFSREGLIRNDYCHARSRDLENRTWKRPGSPKLFLSYS